jgi:hypothetical protein
MWDFDPLMTNSKYLNLLVRLRKAHGWKKEKITEDLYMLNRKQTEIVKRILAISIHMVAIMIMSACQKSVDSFSLLEEQSTFRQASSFSAKPIDILWVIDNSGSMATSQSNLASNFSSFINLFQQQGLDFRMSVTTTDSYVGNYYHNNSMSRWKSGNGSTNTGVFVMTPSTNNLSSVFTTIINQGISGSGDERAFDSITTALMNPLNTDFRRPGAFLAVIIVSDEDDFSHNDWNNGVNSYFFTNNYNDPSIESLASVKASLDLINNVVNWGPNYTVNSISITDATCLASLTNAFPDRKISTRYSGLVSLTGGQSLSLCSNFGSNLAFLSNNIAELSSTFVLSRQPIVASIVVIVDGVTVPQNSVNGWTYLSATNAIQFHGSSIPSANAVISITFDPVTVKE